MKDFYGNIFEKTYNIGLEDLNDTNSYQIRSMIQDLRKNFREEKCEPVYETEEQRNAYMISYFPYYIMPVYELIKSFVLPLKLEDYNNKKHINLTYFAGGPCPELFGTLMALGEKLSYIKYNVRILDYEGGWKSQRKVTIGLINNYFDNPLRNLRSITGCDILRSCEDCEDNYEHCMDNIYGNTDICFMQNCLNHMNDEKEFIDNLIKKISYLPKGAVFIIIDLKYEITLNILKKINNEIRDTTSIIAHNIFDDPSYSRCPYEIPSELIKYVFNGENLLIPRKYTRYYYLIFQK